MTTTRLLTCKKFGKEYLEALIGEGAPAQVYRARHQTLGISQGPSWRVNSLISRRTSDSYDNF